MTSLTPGHLFASQSPARICLIALGCALLLSLTPLAAQQRFELPSSKPLSALAARIELPVNAQDSGRQDTAKHGPALGSFEVAQGAILLHFTNVDGGLRLKGSGRGTFQISGADHKWFTADAHLVNGVIVVSTSLVQQPSAARYTWQDPADAVLFNGSGLPAVPFRTDK